MNSQTKKRLPAAAWIMFGMVLGIVLGYMIFVSFPDKKTAAQIAGYVSIVSDVFLRLIKMLIGPLVFSTLVVGIAHMGDAASVGRVFAKALGWFVTASLVSLLLGMLLANLLQPGHNLGLPLPDIGASANLATAKFTLKDFVGHMVPKSFMVNFDVARLADAPMSGSGRPRLWPGWRALASTIPRSSETSEAVMNQPSALAKTRPTEDALPMCAMPTTRVENTSGAISILMSRRKMSETSEM